MSTPRRVTAAVAGLGGQKALALLAYLMLEPGRMHARAVVAALFWPNAAEKQAQRPMKRVRATPAMRMSPSSRMLRFFHHRYQSPYPAAQSSPP